MACMDCYECNLHIDNGGKCEEMYYDCPYDIYIRYAGALKNNTLPKDFTIQELFKKFNTIKESVEDFNKYLAKIPAYDESMVNMELNISDMSDIYSEETYNRFRNILNI